MVQLFDAFLPLPEHFTLYSDWHSEAKSENMGGVWHYLYGYHAYGVFPETCSLYYEYEQLVWKALALSRVSAFMVCWKPLGPGSNKSEAF